MFGKPKMDQDQPWRQYFVSDKSEDGPTHWWGDYNQSSQEVRNARGQLPMLLTENMVITVRVQRPNGQSVFYDVTDHDLYHKLRLAADRA